MLADSNKIINLRTEISSMDKEQIRSLLERVGTLGRYL